MGEGILILRQAQDEDDWNCAYLSIFLMLSLSKHEEVALNDTTTHVPTMFLLFKPLGVLDRTA